MRVIVLNSKICKGFHSSNSWTQSYTHHFPYLYKHLCSSFSLLNINISLILYTPHSLSFSLCMTNIFVHYWFSGYTSLNSLYLLPTHTFIFIIVPTYTVYTPLSSLFSRWSSWILSKACSRLTSVIDIWPMPWDRLIWLLLCVLDGIVGIALYDTSPFCVIFTLGVWAPFILLHYYSLIAQFSEFYPGINL